LFLDIQGFNEGYTDCLEDVEYNIQCLLKNKQNVYLPSKAWHFESQTRNSDPQKNQKMYNDAVNFLIPFVDKRSDELAKLNLSTLIKQ
jgi:GT2 family glycosyltransferase